MLAVLALAGCAELDGERPGSGNEGYRLGGSFDENATQQDYDRAGGLAASLGGDMAFLESFPVQFAASGLTDVACQKLREDLQKEPHVRSVGACQPAGSK